jgi:hypothetical protein
VSTPDLVPFDEFCQGRFFREWVEPRGFVDAANAVLVKSVASCAYISIMRSKKSGMVVDAMRRRMALVIPDAYPELDAGEGGHHFDDRSEESGGDGVAEYRISMCAAPRSSLSVLLGAH